MAYITNDGSRLIERARTEGKSIVFGSVRMNTIYKSDPYSLVQQTDEWFGENHGSVVGCLSHVSVDDVSNVCDSKLAVQCNDNSESWKSLGIYARLDGEEDELLFACESIENGEYKDTTIVELPVTLDGVVADFGLSEGGSGSGGGGEVPANMMTTDTNQTGLSGMKQWSWENYLGDLGSLDNPLNGDRKSSELFVINSIEGDNHIPLDFYSEKFTYADKDGIWHNNATSRLQITSDAVRFNDSSASWSNIIKAAKVEQGFDHASVRQTEGGIEIDGVLISPNSEIKIGAYVIAVIDSNSKIASVRSNERLLDVSAAVIESGTAHRASGIVSSSAGLSFDAPITPAEGQEIYVHWTRNTNP